MGHGRYLRAAALPFGYAAALILVFMMLFTTYAVVMRQVFDAPVLGVIDVMELALVACIFVAMPGIFLRDENIVVDVIDQVVPARVCAVLRAIGLVLTLGFLMLMMWEMREPALEKLNQHEVTMTLGINRFNHWVPILFGFAFSILASVWVLIHYLRGGAPLHEPTGGGASE
ncbi:MAG: TRAP transporter small permease [Alphaproteobacteria bacterium]